VSASVTATCNRANPFRVDLSTETEFRRMYYAWTGFCSPVVSASAKIRIVPVEKSAPPWRSSAGLILETEEGRMCLGGETWMRLLNLNGRG
jgi:hypothetical protein